MIKRMTAFVILSCLILAFGMAAARPGSVGPKQRHCYGLLSPVDGKSNAPSQIIASACFDTFSGAIEAATKGRVHLDASVRPDDVTDDMLNNVMDKSLATDQVVIGIDWDYVNYGASSYTWVTAGSGCTDSNSFNVPTMPAGWDNRVSSAKAYSNCNYFYHYQNTYFGAASVVCSLNCPGMGSVDNATSSEKWQKYP